MNYLATQGAEPKGVGEASAANLTSVGDPFSRPWLRPLVQKHNLCAVDDVRLHVRYIQELLNLIHSHHIMV